MTDQQLDIHVTPMVMVVTTDGDRTAAFSDIALEGDDAATISDVDLKARAARWFDLPAGTLDKYVVERRTTGNIVIMPAPTFGDWDGFDKRVDKHFRTVSTLAVISTIIGWILAVAFLIGACYVVYRILLYAGVF